VIVLTIIADTRQRLGKHNKKHEQIEKLGYSIEHRKLDIGDYMLEGNSSVTVDTKQDLQEVYNNIFTDGRFRREVRRAFENRIKLVVLIEHGGKFKCLEDVQNWESKYGKASGKILFKKMLELHIAYGVDFLFCDKRVTGKKIIEILTGESND
jgi:ERCC4-type nuclease